MLSLQAVQNIDLTKIVELRFAQWNAGTYLLSDIQLLAASTAKMSIPLPSTLTGGTNATVGLVNDSVKNADVVSLTVLANDGVDQGYVAIPLSDGDFTTSQTVQFDMRDTQGNNTVFITLVDTNGATWSAWTEASTQLDQWVTIDFDYSAASDIALNQIVEIRFAQWNAGTYLLADILR